MSFQLSFKPFVLYAVQAFGPAVIQAFIQAVVQAAVQVVVQVVIYGQAWPGPLQHLYTPGLHDQLFSSATCLHGMTSCLHGQTVAHPTTAWIQSCRGQGWRLPGGWTGCHATRGLDSDARGGGQKRRESGGSHGTGRDSHGAHHQHTGRGGGGQSHHHHHHHSNHLDHHNLTTLTKMF